MSHCISEISIFPDWMIDSTLCWFDVPGKHIMLQLCEHCFSVFQESILSDKPHSTVNELEEYAEKSVSSTLYFILQAMGECPCVLISF